MTSKKRRRHTPDQIIRKLAEGNKLLAIYDGSQRARNRRREADVCGCGMQLSLSRGCD